MVAVTAERAFNQLICMSDSSAGEKLASLLRSGGVSLCFMFKLNLHVFILHARISVRGHFLFIVLFI